MFIECYSRVFYHDVHDDRHALYHHHAHPHRGALVSDDAQCGPT